MNWWGFSCCWFFYWLGLVRSTSRSQVRSDRPRTDRTPRSESRVQGRHEISPSHRRVHSYHRRRRWDLLHPSWETPWSVISYSHLSFFFSQNKKSSQKIIKINRGTRDVIGLSPVSRLSDNRDRRPHNVMYKICRKSRSTNIRHKFFMGSKVFFLSHFILFLWRSFRIDLLASRSLWLNIKFKFTLFWKRMVISSYVPMNRKGLINCDK